MVVKWKMSTAFLLNKFIFSQARSTQKFTRYRTLVWQICMTFTDIYFYWYAIVLFLRSHEDLSVVRFNREILIGGELYQTTPNSFKYTCTGCNILIWRCETKFFLNSCIFSDLHELAAHRRDPSRQKEYIIMVNLCTQSLAMLAIHCRYTQTLVHMKTLLLNLQCHVYVIIVD